MSDDLTMGRDLRRALAEAADANRRVLALIAGSRAVVEKVDIGEDFPAADDFDAAGRLLALAICIGRGTATELAVAASLAARVGTERGHGNG